MAMPQRPVGLDMNLSQPNYDLWTNETFMTNYDKLSAKFPIFPLSAKRRVGQFS